MEFGKDLPMACNDFKKAYLLIAGSLDIIEVSDNIKTLSVNSMEEWWSVHKTTYGFSESKQDINDFAKVLEEKMKMKVSKEYFRRPRPKFKVTVEWWKFSWKC